jgi:hypothetical protein
VYLNPAIRCHEYNRLVKWAALAVIAALASTGGCSRAVESKEAVRQAVLDHLAKRADLNLGSMQVDVVAVSFRQNEADATVSFRAKGARDGPSMSMRYTLEKRTGGWIVKGRSEAGTPHGTAGQTTGGLPPGHPQVGGKRASEIPK